MSREQVLERARLAAANRTEDPLKNWIRIQNEECPICMLPLPHEHEAYGAKYCVTCGKTVCLGCVIGTGIAHVRDSGDEEKAFEKATTCPYCRSSTATTTALYDYKSQLEKEMKRVDAGCHEAMRRVGSLYYKGEGEMGLQQDKAEGLKWYHRAAEAGSGNAAHFIGSLYEKGDGVDQDIDKALEYFQKAAELGYIPAFSTIAALLFGKGDIEESMLNLRKAVICGISIEYLFDVLKEGFKEGFITKDEYAFTLRENQKACNEMKSDGRELYLTLRSGP